MSRRRSPDRGPASPVSPPLKSERHDSEPARTGLMRADTRPAQATGRWGRQAGSSVGAGVTPFQTDAAATIRLAMRAERSVTLVSAPQRDGPTTRSCCWPRSPESPRGGARNRGAPGLESHAGGDRDGRGQPSTGIRRPLRPRARCQRPPLVEGLHGIGGINRSLGCAIRSSPSGRCSGCPAAARPRGRQAASAWGLTRTAHPNPPGGARPILGPPGG